MALAGDGDPDERASGDWTPLGYAITRGDTEIVELLLDAGADIELPVDPDDPSMTPLWFAEEFWGLLEIGALLRSRGAVQGTPNPASSLAIAGSRRSPGVEPAALPRWARVLAGLALAVLLLPCLAGSLLLMLVHNEKAPVFAPVIGLAMLLTGLWLFAIACRLVFGRRAPGGLIKPRALRALAWVFLLLPAGGVFTGWFASHPLLAVIQTLACVGTFFRLRSLADARDARARAPSVPASPEEA